MDKNGVRKWAGRLWRSFAISIITLGLVGLYAAIALNLTLFNPVAKVIKNYSINDFFYHKEATNHKEKDVTCHRRGCITPPSFYRFLFFYL